ncbi:MAG: phospho-N-acetylmuramoyl-pentapeptide-transferase [Bacilli bacterium]|nr:phospho-N-acetylmuramoyl-pentapeptide-transferase [Bacilli bacterium]
MYQLTKGVLALMIGFMISIVFGVILVPLLKKLKAKQSLSSFLFKKHKEKEGTPTMGGLIFIIPTILAIIILLVWNKIEFSANLFIVMFVFLSYALLGFIDDYLIIKRKNNEGLTVVQKLIGQILIAIIFFIIYMKSGAEPVVEIYTLGIEIPLGWFYGFFILFMLVASSNAVNITDGLDGLAGGLSMIAFLTFALISANSPAIQGTGDIAVFCFVLVGCLLGFLAFNSRPAKVFMGDTGSLALGATMATIAIITKHEFTFIIVAGVFIFETLVCLIQIISMVFFHKKVFLMTPFHHHLEKLGWKERDIVITFWCIGLLLSMAAILFGVWY